VKVTRSKLLFVLLILAATAVAAEPKKDKKRSKEPVELVDSGSFGVFVNGRRVATESFTIEKRPSMSVVSSQFTVEDGSNAAHSAELQLAPNGDMREYRWKEIRPGKAENIVRYAESFITQQVALRPEDKPRDLVYMLPAATQVLDDYFFSHLEVLLWRYMGAGCDIPRGTCELKKTQFGIFVPRRETPFVAAMEYRGKERVVLRGTEVQLAKFALVIEGEEWSLWMQDQGMKLMRVYIPGSKTEVVRD
jgi:hypothetical protein